MSETSNGTRAFIGVGANLGFARDAVLNALADLSELPETEFVGASGLYRSEPIESSGPDYFNAVAEVRTFLSPLDLLYALFAIEKRYGRVRTVKNAPRTLDLDLLLYGDVQIATPELTVPHPRVTERAFTLLPLLELDPEIDIPGRGPARPFLAGCTAQAIERLDP
ncbi:MAG: 2-amino-4-hydroxy-6-hydroxymethyldihydropteridine diphosphokinase [Burkholderiaceae bacterium]|jgi:2-amino-4-hydroxy-6-hydroxymethyldihydropteridine diphosphokinase